MKKYFLLALIIIIILSVNSNFAMAKVNDKNQKGQNRFRDRQDMFLDIGIGRGESIEMQISNAKDMISRLESRLNRKKDKGIDISSSLTKLDAIKLLVNEALLNPKKENLRKDLFQARQDLRETIFKDLKVN